MKYSDVPMPLKEGEYQWEHVRIFDRETKQWKDQWRQPEEKDIQERIERDFDGETPETDTYYLEGREEYWDFETICKACGTRFMAYDTKHKERVRNYCPGCGKKLIEKEAEHENL